MSAAALHLDTMGPVTAPPVMFLHGFLGSSADWRPVMDAFAVRNRCLAVDLPGHGRSLHLEEPCYRFDGCVEALAALLEGEREPVRVVGYSMGGRLALALACRHPGRVEALLLESASAGLESEAARMERVQSDEDWARRLEQEPLDRILLEWYGQPLFASMDRYPGLLESLLTERGSGEGAEYAKALRGMGLGRQPCLQHDLTALTVPVRWLAGEHDPKFLSIAQAMTGLSPRADAVIVPDAGHNLHREQPGRFLRELTRWLDHPA